MIVACTCLVPLVVGTGVLGYFPKPVLGGLLFFLGASFLVENVYDAWFRLPRGEYALVLAILAVVVAVGFLEGVAFGIVVSSILFALNYARVGVVRHETTGTLLRSKASRSLSDEALLRSEGARVRVFQLQGYVFFGTAHGLLQKVKEHAGAAFVVLDFRHVTGLDASAVVSFVRMTKAGSTLVLTELPAQVHQQLERGGALGAAKVFPDLDRGLEHCERALLATAAAPPPDSQIRGALDHIVGDPALVTRLLGYFDTLHIAAGADVFRAGDPSDALFLIEAGEVEAWLDLGGGRSRRLRAMGPGTVLGEAGIYLGAPRSAGVRATTASVLLRLPVAALDRMTGDAPELAAAFHRFVAATLADRIVTTTSATQAVFH
jgi:SulP family sulfate permease